MAEGVPAFRRSAAQQFVKGLFSLSAHDVRNAGGGILLDMIDRVRSVNNHRAAAFTGHGGHPLCRLTHPGEAHLRQIVEVVIVDHQHARLMERQRRAKILLGAGKHAVEETDGEPALAGDCGRVQRPEGRIRHHCLPFLRIKPQEVGVGEEHINHGRFPGGDPSGRVFARTDPGCASESCRRMPGIRRGST